MPTSAAVDAATIVVVRDHVEPCEVLLVRRHGESRAFAGAHVFPGGVVDAGDDLPALRGASRLAPETAAARLGEAARPPTALAFWIAAVRELFEESGLLLACREDAALDLGDPATVARFVQYRAALLDGRVDFATLVAAERLRLATDDIEYLSRWITPVTAPRRYDTRFFVTRLPPGQEAKHDARETTAVGWFAPAAALAASRRGELLLTPPTLRTLEDLQPLGGWTAIVAAARARPVAPILPKVVTIAGRMVVLYPGDAAYEEAVPGDPVADSTSGARNRAVMEDGGWRTQRSGG